MNIACNLNIWQSRRSGLELTRPDDLRCAYDRDRARIIHSAAFRRLQAKTQILGIAEGDFHRTRLTHSMEVAQISRGLVNKLAGLYPALTGILPTTDLAEAIGLAHDLGHPPFGHSGENALNQLMADYGGFEANAQTLRILTRWESHTPSFGLDLTRRTLLGLMKYPVAYSRVLSLGELANPPKSYFDIDQEIVDWIFAPFNPSDRELFISIDTPTEHNHGKALYKSLDASIMEVADDIAYGTHDVEDGIMLGHIKREHWPTVAAALDADWAAKYGLVDLEKMLFDTGSQASHNLKRTIGAIVNALISSVWVKELPHFEQPLLKYNAALQPAAEKFLAALKNVSYQHFILSHRVEEKTKRGQIMIKAMFKAYLENPNRLPENVRRHGKDNATASTHRLICDYIAGMTDGFAVKTYEALTL